MKPVNLLCCNALYSKTRVVPSGGIILHHYSCLTMARCPRRVSSAFMTTAALWLDLINLAVSAKTCNQVLCHY